LRSSNPLTWPVYSANLHRGGGQNGDRHELLSPGIRSLANELGRFRYLPGDIEQKPGFAINDTMRIDKHLASRSKRYLGGSFLGKLRKRGIIGALATIIGSGWVVYEIVHFILVEHYHLPPRLKDIVIVSTLCILFCTLTWRWFRAEKRKRKVKWEYVLLALFIFLINVADGYRLWSETYDRHLNDIFAVCFFELI